MYVSTPLEHFLLIERVRIRLRASAVSVRLPILGFPLSFPMSTVCFSRKIAAALIVLML